MKENMRKETKIGLLLFAIFNILNFITKEVGTEMPILHFCLGVLTGLAFLYIIIGLLPESNYLKLRRFKKGKCI